MIDRIFNNRYRVVRILGFGSTGPIYLAADTQHPDFAVCAIRELKLPHQNSHSLTQLQFLLVHKSEALARISQTNPYPEILNFFIAERKFYLVEELMTICQSI